MRVGPYWTHLKELGQHVINGIPPCANILQELQGLDFDNLRRLIREPPFLVAILEITIEGVSTFTWSSNSSDRCPSLWYGTRRDGVVTRQRVSVLVTSHTRCSIYHPSRTKINNVGEAHDPTIMCIKGNVTRCQHCLKRLHHGIIIQRVVEGDMSHLE